MKNFIKMLLCLALFPTAVMSKNVAGVGPVITQNRYHAGFTAISSNLDATIVFMQGASYSIAVSGQQNILDKISSAVSGNELILDYSGNDNIGWHQPVTITITAPDVTSFTLNGTGDLRASDVRAPGKTLQLWVNNAGSIYLGHITAGSINKKVGGSGRISIAEGTANDEVRDITGSGTMNFQNMRFPNSRIHNARYGTSGVRMNSDVDADISGNRNGYYPGSSDFNSGIYNTGAATAIRIKRN